MGENATLDRQAENLVKTWLNSKEVPDKSMLKLEASTLKSAIDPYEVYVYINDQVRNYGQLHKDTSKESENYFFYIYVPAELLEGEHKKKHKSEIIAALRDRLR